MKTFLAVFSVTAASLVVRGQDCSLSSMSVNVGSQPTYLSLHHPGPYLYTPGANNTIEWTVKDVQNSIIFQDSVVGNGSVGFNHNIPTTDSMMVRSLLFNPSLGLVCQIEDTVFWKATEILPGVYTYRWAFVGGDGSQSGINVLSDEERSEPRKLSIGPSPAYSDLWFRGEEGFFEIRVINGLGQCVRTAQNVQGVYQMDVSTLPAGSYLVEIWNNATVERVRVVKQ